MTLPRKARCPGLHSLPATRALGSSAWLSMSNAGTRRRLPSSLAKLRVRTCWAGAAGSGAGCLGRSNKW